jgi:predicted nuclease with TOPRIM domain
VKDHIPDVTKMLDETPCKATPREELRNQIMSSIIPKNEREWWAKRTIEQLERELNAANDRIKRLEEDSERLNWLLDRGLAWRDCYDDFWKEGEWLYASQSALETIDKAKEAKP